jgi:hypothetical protein
MVAVRPEFRADELVFDPADPVFGGSVCRVAACPRTARGGALGDQRSARTRSGNDQPG